jgi:hypothetical protein
LRRRSVESRTGPCPRGNETDAARHKRGCLTPSLTPIPFKET